MADSIKIGSINISAFKVGSDDCKIYLGDTLLYPKTNYFTIRSLADNNTITLRNNAGTLIQETTFYYSIDRGATWTYFKVTRGTTKTIATLNNGDRLMLKGINGTLGTAYNAGHYFRATGIFEVEGNIMSLLRNNDTDTEFVGGTNNFSQLFSGCTNLVNAENLMIPASAMTAGAFNGTFRGCTSLTKAPELPATVMADSCYSSMFEGCTSLYQPPSVLSATSFATNCYQRMFCMNRTSKVTSAMKYTPKMYGNVSNSSLSFAQQMLCGNGGLETVECYITVEGGQSLFDQTGWMNYVNTTGTFKKLSTQTFSNGVGGIPVGWTVVNDDTTQP